MKYPILFCLLTVVSLKASAQSLDTIAIENVNVIPMTDEFVLCNQRVLIHNGKIIKIEDATLPRPATVNQIISGAGKYLIGDSVYADHFTSLPADHWFSRGLSDLLVAN